MKYSVLITILPDENLSEEQLKKRAAAELAKQHIKIRVQDITAFVFRKKSVDARKKQVKLHLRYDLCTEGTPADENIDAYKPAWRKVTDAEPVIIVGNGPAGLFAALTLLEQGLKPVLIEQGPDAHTRKKDIAAISTKGTVNPYSNYCFGEGGAGTFSDGKLYSRSNKRGNIPRILAILVRHGADPRIMTDAHPHIGSDKLPEIIGAINRTITDFGGEVHFNTCVTDLIAVPCDSAEKNGAKTVAGVRVKNTVSGAESEFRAKAVILATGHSSKEIYRIINRIQPSALEAKTFAAGLRVEHPRQLIDSIQLHGAQNKESLGAAEYRLTTQVDGRGVYSFCMCPGGLVVPSASEQDGIVVNGMSPSSRGGRFSNAAIVVETRPEDYGAKSGIDGLNFRTEIEEKARQQAASAAAQTVLSAQKADRCPAGGNPDSDSQAAALIALNPQTAPAQRLSDFMNDKVSDTLPPTSYTAPLASVDMRTVLPAFITDRLKAAFKVFNNQMKGFISPDALLIAPETRTSTPVRILRNPETLESDAIKGLFPAGEGAGYAGGIVSSAMDGEKSALAVASVFNKHFLES